MQYSTNNKLKLMEGTDNVKRQDFVDNFNIIDNGLSKFYVATQSSTNVYKVTTGNSLTALQNGYSIRVAIPKDSTGAVSVIVDSVTVAVKQPNGNAVTNFKANGVYSLTYYNKVFILASGGVDTVSFSASDLLTGKSANNSNGEKVNGAMANNGVKDIDLGINQTITLQKGYYDRIKITQNIPNRGEAQYAGHLGMGTDYLALADIPYGYYPKSDNGWAPEIRIKKFDLANFLGLTANKIVSGNNILGIDGIATLETLSLIKSGTAIVAGEGGSIPGSLFNDIDNYMIFNYCIDNDTHYISLFTKPSGSKIIRFNTIFGDKTGIGEQLQGEVYYYWYEGDLIYNRGYNSKWDGKTFKYKIYKITNMLTF